MRCWRWAKGEWEKCLQTATVLGYVNIDSMRRDTRRTVFLITVSDLHKEQPQISLRGEGYSMGSTFRGCSEMSVPASRGRAGLHDEYAGLLQSP